MNRMGGSVLSPSYFWDCLQLNENCPFFSGSDPKLYYFAVGMTALYVSLIVTILCDIKFNWSVNNLFYQVDNCLNFLKQKIRDVQVNQRQLVSTQEKAEKQLKQSNRYNKMVSVLRFNIAHHPSKVFFFEQNRGETAENYGEQNHIIDFTEEDAEFTF
ncbi:unnamed protein product [Pieris brassicae]|uniref:Uncharacterized protein n=1 Tax=Pieris brassicae TaxID=7116 RepID=A0A9P0U2W5_PIEBR|nr:unnamed protein product [Pieris brassicae]